MFFQWYFIIAVSPIFPFPNGNVYQGYHAPFHQRISSGGEEVHIIVLSVCRSPNQEELRTDLAERPMYPIELDWIGFWDVSPEARLR